MSTRIFLIRASNNLSTTDIATSPILSGWVDKLLMDWIIHVFISASISFNWTIGLASTAGEVRRWQWEVERPKWCSATAQPSPVASVGYRFVRLHFGCLQRQADCDDFTHSIMKDQVIQLRQDVEDIQNYPLLPPITSNRQSASTGHFPLVAGTWSHSPHINICWKVNVVVE